MSKFLLLFSVLLSISSFAQDIAHARKVVDTLTSPYFSGRGAANQGEKKAADYIASVYQSIGLQKFNNTYFQTFTSPINTIIGALSVQLDKEPLIAGKDYLVDAASGKISGTFQLVWYTKENVPSKKQLKKLIKKDFFHNKFIIVDEEGVEEGAEVFQILRQNAVEASGVIFLEKKLTQHLSKTNKEYGILHILRDKISTNHTTITLTIPQEFLPNYQSQNVIGSIKGTQHPDSFIVLSAHYDHLGRMGDSVYFPGANDNASGVAMLLNMASHYMENPPKKSVVFIAFGAEEIGLVGSKYFVEHPLVSLHQINFVFNMDLMGTGIEGAMIVNGRVFETHFEKLKKINEKNGYLVQLKKRGKAANSDHYWFSEKGIPAFFIYLMGGITAYHDIYDLAETLPLTKFEDSFRLITDFLNDL
jgi:putative aminopeptidase FrvX